VVDNLCVALFSAVNLEMPGDARARFVKAYMVAGTVAFVTSGFREET